MTKMPSRIWLGTAMVLAALVPQAALAATLLQQNKWDSVPRVQITLGAGEQCQDNPMVYDGAMARGYSHTFATMGDGGPTICYRRSVDPDDDTSSLGDSWTRCAWSGECDVS